MAKQNEYANPTEEVNSDSESEVHSLSEEVQNLISQINFLKSEFDDLIDKFKQEKSLVLTYQDEKALYKCLAEDRENEKSLIRAEKAKLETKISELQKELVNVKDEKVDFKCKFEVCYQERSEAYAK